MKTLDRVELKTRQGETVGTIVARRPKTDQVYLICDDPKFDNWYPDMWSDDDE